MRNETTEDEIPLSVLVAGRVVVSALVVVSTPLFFLGCMARGMVFGAGDALILTVKFLHTVWCARIPSWLIR